MFNCQIYQSFQALWACLQFILQASFLARQCAVKTVVDYWGASMLNYAINLQKWCCCQWSKPAPEPKPRWWSYRGLCSSLIPVTANCVHQPPWMHLNLPDVGYSLKMHMAVLEVISSLVGFARFFFKSIAWKEGGGVGISAALFLLLSNLVF